jgi:hypothetical protein
MKSHCLATEGFAVVPGVLTHTDCEDIAAKVTQAWAPSAGTRCLLPLDWCQALAARPAPTPGNLCVRAMLSNTASAAQDQRRAADAWPLAPRCSIAEACTSNRQSKLMALGLLSGRKR